MSVRGCAVGGIDVSVRGCAVGAIDVFVRGCAVGAIHVSEVVLLVLLILHQH